MIEINFPFKCKNISRRTHSGFGTGMAEGLIVIHPFIHLNFVLSKHIDITYSKK